MDPQQDPANQSTSTPPVSNDTMSPSEPTPVVTQTAAPSSATPSSSLVPTASSKKPLFGGIAALVIIIVALLLSWFLYFSPAAQAKRLSNRFMHNITTGDVTKATDLTGDNTAKDFLTSASKNVHGSYKLSESKFSNDKGYYLYKLSGAAKQYARTIIAKDHGKRVVNSFVFSGTPLALMPSSSSSSTSDNSAEQSMPTSSNSASCLNANDFSSFSNVGMGTPVANGNGTYTAFFQLKFNPDVATYATDENPDPATVFNDFKNFYAQNANKKYILELEASVNSATPDVPLATARNNKVQADLENISGIPASKITIQPVTNDTSGQNNAGDAFFRQVQVTLRSADNCATS